MDQPTADTALSHAARLLKGAEVELDLAKMKAITDLADTWVTMAAILAERETA